MKYKLKAKISTCGDRCAGDCPQLSKVCSPKAYCELLGEDLERKIGFEQFPIVRHACCRHITKEIAGEV